jgi:hypothetical protein
VDETETKLFRCSFSKSLLEFIVENYYPTYKVIRLKYRLGKALSKEDKSKSGIYAIMSAAKGIVLRVSMFEEAAKMMTEDESRYLQEIYLEI